ncbi:uncharacterized protein LOC143020253 [Oratosquilla oratoria]|uniref:uncharacterized protein LOC143020253 n=1 Tax=Oratosquilla oratoria TaxID=337810 RepID=UPI003F75EAD6
MADGGNSGIIPVVDVGPIKFGKEDPALEDCKNVGNQLSKAFADIGFAYLSNHGIPTEEIKKCYEAAVDFFALPNQTKMKYLRMPGNQHGYSEMNKEKVDPKDPLTEVHEAFNFLDQDCPDDEVPHFRRDLNALSDTCKRFVYALLKCLSLSLELDPGFFKKYHDLSSPKNISNLRVLHYPSVSKDENVTRLGAHTDFGTITMVFQDAVGGLQVKNREGQWVNARPVPGTVLVNIGDLLQRWTGDKWTATLHRVTLPYDEMRKQRRLSMAFFVVPDDQVMVEPVCGNKSYGKFNSTEFMMKKMKEIYSYD